MKVYIIYYETYDDEYYADQVFAIFASEEKAKDRVKEFNDFLLKYNCHIDSDHKPDSVKRIEISELFFHTFGKELIDRIGAQGSLFRCGIAHEVQGME